MGYKFDIKRDRELNDQIWVAMCHRESTTALMAEREALWATYHNHPKVAMTNSPAMILDDSAILAAYKKRKPYVPRYKKRPASTRATGKRVTGFDGDYSIPYKPRKVTKLPETTPDKAHAGWYLDGFWTNGQYVILAPCPKTKRPLNLVTDRFERLLADNQDTRDLTPATIGKETYGGNGCRPLVTVGDVPIPADQLDIIFHYYPNAQALIGVQNMVRFTDCDYMIGMVMVVTK